MLVGLLHLVSCFDEEDITYEQLTAEQLRHLYLLDTNFVYTGDPVERTDTVYFLLDKKDTVNVVVITQVNAFDGSIFHGREKKVSGHSSLEFESGDVTFANVSNSISIYTHDSRSFSLSTENLLKKDTAKVLGNIYSEVFKLTQGKNESRFGFDKVYFALDHGFVLIKLEDGTLYQLIK